MIISELLKVAFVLMQVTIKNNIYAININILLESASTLLFACLFGDMIFRMKYGVEEIEVKTHASIVQIMMYKDVLPK